MNRGLAILLLSATLLIRAAAAAPDLAGGIATFNRAFNDWSATGFQRAAETFAKTAAQHPRSAAPHYWQGVARFHRMLVFQSGNNPAQNATQAAREMDTAIQTLETAVEIEPHHAEAHALLGTLYGMKIQGSTFRALRYGPRIHQHHQLALRHGATNPRVRYLSGAALFHTADHPADFNNALTELRLAEKAFASEATRQPLPGQPRWGASSCQTFIGRTLEKLGRTSEATAAYRKALALHPKDHLAAAALQRLNSHPTPPSP